MPFPLTSPHIERGDSVGDDLAPLPRRQCFSGLFQHVLQTNLFRWSLIVPETTKVRVAHAFGKNRDLKSVFARVMIQFVSGAEGYAGPQACLMGGRYCFVLRLI